MHFSIGKRTDTAGNTVYVLFVNGAEASQHPSEQELYLEVQRLMGEEGLTKAAEDKARALQENFEKLIGQNSPDDAPDDAPRLR